MATRLFLQSLDTVPADQWRLASQLGMTPAPVFRLIEWPAMRAVLPGIAGLVFMLCVTSFTIVLTLGGGPRASTLEVAIYQALRFDFDPARAVALTVVQVVLTAVAVALLARLGANDDRRGGYFLVTAAGNVDRSCGTGSKYRWHYPGRCTVCGRADRGHHCRRAWCRPRTSAIRSGGGARDIDQSRPCRTIGGDFRCAGWALSAGQTHPGGGAGKLPRRFLARLMDSGAGFVLVVPPIVIGAGWFMLLRQSTDVAGAGARDGGRCQCGDGDAFVLRALRPAYDSAGGRHDRIAAQLGIAGWNRLRLIDWPVMRRPLFTALSFAMALSLGDLGVIALFGSDRSRRFLICSIRAWALSHRGCGRAGAVAGGGLPRWWLTLTVAGLAAGGTNAMSDAHGAARL